MATGTTPTKQILAVKETVQNQIMEYKAEKKINLPTNYSPDNALLQFQLMVQDDEKVMACTMGSIAKCMLDMCVMGLNPSKKQCYVIPYGNKATLMPSYEGNKAIAKRIDPTIKDIFARTICKGEDFDFEDLPNGYSKILKHKRTLDSMTIKDPMNDIVGAYATIIRTDGTEESLIMPFSEIVKRWKMSKAKPFAESGKLKAGTVHYDFPDKMCERTVINAICKPIIASSNDTDLFSTTVQSTYIDAEKAEAEAEIAENMSNADYVDINDEEVIECDEFGVVLEDEKTQE